MNAIVALDIGIHFSSQKYQLLTNIQPDNNSIISKNEPSCADQKAENL